MMVRSGLRSRLVVLVLVALLPLVGLSIHKAWRDAQSARDGADASLQFTASLAASNLTHIADSARSLLLAVATTPGLRETRSPDCGEVFTRLHDRFPGYASFGLVDAAGNVQCRTRAVTGITSVAGSARFREAVQRDAFIVSALLRGPGPGPAIVAFAQPVLDAQGNSSGAAFAAMELGAVLRGVEEIPLGPDAQLVMLDRNAAVIAARPAGANAVGPRVPAAAQREFEARREPMRAEGTDSAG
ncbi:MAG: cache domain-containing protein, partial [Burkholderiaceae bacterium]